MVALEYEVPVKSTMAYPQLETPDSKRRTKLHILMGLVETLIIFIIRIWLG